jgi:hypothetical protein
MLNWNSPQKNMMRSKAVAFDGRPANVAFMMPSYQCLCVNEAMKQGTIGPNTDIIWAERDKEVQNKIVDFFDVNEKRFHDDFHVLELCTDFDRDVKYHKDGKDFQNFGSVKNFLNGRKIDFAFLDTCGNLNHNILQWLSKHDKYFTDDARISFTFCEKYRSNGGLLNITKDEFSAFTPETLAALSCQNSNIIGLSLLNSNILIMIQLLSLAFTEHSFQVVDCYSYKNDESRTKMMFIQLKLTGQKKHSSISAVERIVESYLNTCNTGENEMKKTPAITETKMTLKTFISHLYDDYKRFTDLPAAKLAWLTRLSKAEGKSPQRVASAVKAWYTMRKSA